MNKKFKKIFLLFLLILIISLFIFLYLYKKNYKWYRDKNIVNKIEKVVQVSKDNKSRVAVFIVKNPEDFIKTWQKPAYIVKTKLARNLYTYNEYGIFVTFSNCKANSNNRCELVGDFVILDPERKIFMENKSFDIYNDWPKMHTDKVEIAKNYIFMILDNKDKKGNYILYSKIIDKVSKETYYLSYSFSLRK